MSMFGQAALRLPTAPTEKKILATATPMTRPEWPRPWRYKRRVSASRGEKKKDANGEEARRRAEEARGGGGGGEN